MKSYALGVCVNGSVTCWFCNWFSLVGLTEIFLCFVSFSIISPFFHLGYCVNFVLQLGRVSPHVNGVDFGFNRWLNSYSRCELKWHFVMLRSTGGWPRTHGVRHKWPVVIQRFNRWLKFCSRCEPKRTGGHSSVFQPEVEVVLTVWVKWHLVMVAVGDGSSEPGGSTISCATKCTCLRGSCTEYPPLAHPFNGWSAIKLRCQMFFIIVLATPPT